MVIFSMLDKCKCGAPLELKETKAGKKRKNFDGPFYFTHIWHCTNEDCKKTYLDNEYKVINENCGRLDPLPPMDETHEEVETSLRIVLSKNQLKQLAKHIAREMRNG